MVFGVKLWSKNNYFNNGDRADNSPVSTGKFEWYGKADNDAICTERNEN